MFSTHGKCSICSFQFNLWNVFTKTFMIKLLFGTSLWVTGLAHTHRHQVQSCCVRFLSILFYPSPFFSLLSSGLVPSNHYTTDDLIPPRIFTIIQFFVAGPLQRNTQLYLLETNNQNHTDNASSHPSARLSTYTQPHQQS
jgi:hypothetical protein